VKLSDGGGLQLWITPMVQSVGEYRFGGAQKTLAVGVYREIGLKDARDAREAVRRTLALGRDPSQVQKAAKAAQTEAGANTSEPLQANWRTRSVATGRQRQRCGSSNGS
jgi:hypothetical protein